MLLYDAVKFLKVSEREEIINLINRCKEIDSLLASDAECDRISLIREKRMLSKKATLILAKVESIRLELEAVKQEETNDGKDIQIKRECKFLGLFRRRKKESVD